MQESLTAASDPPGTPLDELTVLPRSLAGDGEGVGCYPPHPYSIQPIVYTCRAESPGGTQAYSSRAQPLSSSDAADGQLCAADVWTAPAAVDGDLGDRCDGPRGAVGEASSSGGGGGVDDDDGGLATTCPPRSPRWSRDRQTGILAGGWRRDVSRQLLIVGSMLYTYAHTAITTSTISIQPRDWLGRASPNDLFWVE